MKHLYRLAVILIVLGFAGTAVFLILAPDIIPAHYNFAGEADRMGSKYEYTLLPVISAGWVRFFFCWQNRLALRSGRVLP